MEYSNKSQKRQEEQARPRQSMEDYDTVIIGGGPAGTLFLLSALGKDLLDPNSPANPWLPTGKICSLPGPPSSAFGKGPPDYDHHLTESGTEDRPRSNKQAHFEQECRRALKEHPDSIISHPGAIASKIEREGSGFKVTFSSEGEERVCTAKRLVIATGHSDKRAEDTCNIDHLKGSRGLSETLQKLLDEERQKTGASSSTPESLKAAAFRNFIESLPVDTDGKRVLGLVGDGPTMDEVIKILFKERENALSFPPAGNANDPLDSNRFKVVIFSSKCQRDVKKDLDNDWIRSLPEYDRDNPDLSAVQQLANGAWSRVNAEATPRDPLNPSDPRHKLADRLLKLAKDGILSVCGRFDWSQVEANSKTKLLIHPEPPLKPQANNSGSPPPTGAHLKLSLLIDCAPMPIGSHDYRDGQFVLRSKQHQILDDLLKIGVVEFDKDSIRSKVGVLKSNDSNVQLIGAGFERNNLAVFQWITQSAEAREALRKQEQMDLNAGSPLANASFPSGHRPTTIAIHP